MLNRCENSASKLERAKDLHFSLLLCRNKILNVYDNCNTENQTVLWPNDFGEIFV